MNLSGNFTVICSCTPSQNLCSQIKLQSYLTATAEIRNGAKDQNESVTSPRHSLSETDQVHDVQNVTHFSW